jgi:hypothetical protein
VEAYKNNKNRLTTFRTPVPGVLEALAEAAAAQTQNKAIRWKGPKCRSRPIRTHALNPVTAPTARKTQRKVRLCSESGNPVPATRKQPMVTGKKTVSKRHMQASTTSTIRMAPKYVEFDAYPGLRSARKHNPAKPTIIAEMISNRC